GGIRRPCCKNGRRRAECRRRPIVRSSAKVRTTIRNSASRWSFRNWGRPRGSAGPSVPRSKPPQRLCSPARVSKLIASDTKGSRPAAASPEREGGKGISAPGATAQIRCGFIALIGAPNVGKSTLINALVGTKVAIVSHKAQTTRALLRGIAIAGASQLVFIDTPGIFAPKRRLDRAMVSNAWTGAHDADIVGLLIDARRGLDEEADTILARLAEARQTN